MTWRENTFSEIENRNSSSMIIIPHDGNRVCREWTLPLTLDLENTGVDISNGS